MLAEEIERIRRARDDFLAITIDVLYLDAFAIDAGDLRRKASARSQALCDALSSEYNKRFLALTKKRVQTYEAAADVLCREPWSIEAFAELCISLEQLESLLRESATFRDDARDSLDILDEVKVLFTDEDSLYVWSSFRWPALLKEYGAKAHLKMPDYIKNFEREIEMKRSTVDDAHLRCKEALVRVMKQGIGDLPDAEIIKDEIETLEEDVQELIGEAAALNANEALISSTCSDYSGLQSILSDLVPYAKLWKITHEWQSRRPLIMDASFFAVDASSTKQFLDGALEEIAEANKLLALCDSKAVETALPVADEIQRQMHSLVPYMPIIVALRDPAIRRRHWTRLSEELRALPGSNQFEESSTIDVHIDNKTLSLRLLLESGATKCMTQIREISAVAFKEYEIELALGKMEAEWREKCPDGKTNKVALTLVQYATR